jgi:hypothetical protein
MYSASDVAKLPSILAAGDPADIALASDYTRRISLWAGQSADSTVKPAEVSASFYSFQRDPKNETDAIGPLPAFGDESALGGVPGQ